MTDNNELSQVAVDAMQAVADSITLARTARGLTQAEVAAGCGISIGTYQSVERGSLSPSMRAYVTVLDYFGLASSVAFLGAPPFDKEGQLLRASTKKNNP